MRKLLNTLFVTSEDKYLALENENVVVLDSEDKAVRFPLMILEGIVSFSYKGASPALMGACAKRGIQLSFMTPNGRFLARTCGEDRGNVLLRKKQYRISDDEKASCRIARNFIVGKVHNGRWILGRAVRDHEMRINAGAVRLAANQMAGCLPEIAQTESLETLRGLEGEVASRFFSVFDELILNQKEAFFFDGRNRRPPEDNVNAMLSFAYTLLANDCASALESVGLDSYVGFLHRDHPGRASLALDLMEELRGVFAERLVVSLINNREITAKHFQKQPGGAVFLDDAGRKILLNAWQTRKREQITHPYLGEKLYWGLVPYVQALLLARYLRGDLDEYPPFLWK